jgi:hypothetical protein
MAWKFKYLDKVPCPTSPALLFGSAAHGAIEGYLTNGKQTSLADEFRKSWAEQLERNQTVSWGMDSPEEMANDGIRILTHPDVVAGINAIEVGMAGDNPTIETKVEIRVPGVPIPLVGYIDIITKDGVPGDFKTSGTKWSVDKAIGETQPLVYLAALNQLDPKKTQWNFRHYVIVKTKTPQWQMIEHAHNPAQLMWLFKMIKNAWDAINAGAFVENPGSWKCSASYCEFWNICRGKYQ